jgi:cation diffusion facilitator CzcD-associated flavoprotein CzcO
MTAEHVDVLIVGAGLSGIGFARHLQTRCPGKSFLLLEARDAIGGTWDLFRYPGIRSDSDMYTFGFRFRPWKGDRALADGPSILAYLRETAAEGGLDDKIRFRHRVVQADWSTEDRCWTLHVLRTDTDELVTFTASFVQNCGGYYRYDKGYTPTFPGRERFTGPVVHPQHWPEDLDYQGKKVVVIGSGATAITVVPAMAQRGAGHVTMLQRSPTYVLSMPAEDAIAKRLRAWLPEESAYRVTRWKNILRSLYLYQMSRRRPDDVRAWIRGELKKQLPPGYPIDVHFKPRYDPWDQRLCAVPDGDLFKAISDGSVSVVTDTIATFTEGGILLDSGETLEADIIVTATGFTLQMLGGAELRIDGEHVSYGDRMTYKGMMISGVPNAAFTVGYTNSSWTLKADLVGTYVCRVLNHMDANGYTMCLPDADDDVERTPLLDFGAGYVQRSVSELPKQGPGYPWRLRMNYLGDLVSLRYGRVDDGVMQYRR